MNALRRIDIDTAARTVWAEARGEGPLGMRAVAWVMKNRLARPCWWSRERGDGTPDDTLEAVARDPWQFSCWNTDDPNLPKLLAADFDDIDFRRAWHAVLQAIDEPAQLDPTHGATHYHVYENGWPAGWGPRSKWKELSTIYHHRFYKEL